MARQLDQTIVSQLSRSSISAKFIFKVNGVVCTNYLLDYSLSYSTQFGSASGTFTLNNAGGYFGIGGTQPINVGDTVELTEQYIGSGTQWKSFYGTVEQRTIMNDPMGRTIQLTCLDYIAFLKHWDVDFVAEGTKVEITEETLTPNFLPAPNDMFAQIFNFANNAISQNPLPILTIRDKNNLSEDPQYSGFQVSYDVGQVQLGSPLQARDNYDLVAKSYFFYTQGLYCEDIIQSLLTLPDGYGNYLFNEATAQAVIDNHLTTTIATETGSNIDAMTPNYTTSTVTIQHQLTHPTSAGDTKIYLDSVAGLPSSGTANLSGDIFTYTSIGSGNVLLGIPQSGASSIHAHPSGSYLSYTKTYTTGQVWYLTYSNIQTALISGDFTIPGATLQYFDARNGRIVLSNNIPLTSVVTCNRDYKFRTLQSTGVQLNYIAFRQREVNTRYDAIDKVRQYLAPNYIIRTQGDNKVWSSYLYQKPVADYNLTLIERINYMEATDLYTRVLLFGTNKNPTNIMYNTGIGFVTGAGSYKAFASQVVLNYDHSDDQWHYFTTLISNAGRIDVTNYTPKVYINAIPIDNQLHQLVAQPIKVQQTTTTVTTQTSGGK